MKTSTIAACAVIAAASFEASLALEGSWGRFYTLRDDTNTWTDGKPPGGWYVTGIHQNLLPSGKVLVTGWGRQAEFSCIHGNGPSSTSRRRGVSFVIDPNDLANDPAGGFTTFNIFPTHENGKSVDDVLYCSGHTTLPDSTKLFVGGSTYQNLGGGQAEQEFGLDFARVYDPNSNTFNVVQQTAPFGTAWYPTTMMLPDLRVLVSKGFGRCCDGNQAADLATFDYQKYKNGKVNPWLSVLSDDESRADIKPGIKDYTRLWVLPEPIEVNGRMRHVAMMGAQGTISFYNTDENLAKEHRFATRPNSRRPGACGWDTTGAVLATGELLVAGGCRAMIDKYNYKTDTWTSIGMETRHTSSSVLLPDGNVLIINGENPSIDQNTGNGGGGDPRFPKVYNPFDNSVETLNPEPADGPPSLEHGQSAFRGYHNSVLLLKDGSILVSGGVHKEGDIGCEQPNLRKLFPSYLSRSARPSISSLSTNEFAVDGGESILISYSSSAFPLRESSENGRSGAVLMALGAFTHSYDQNQRYVPLRYEDAGNGQIRVFAPKRPRAIPGDYVLYLVSSDGVPSVGESVKLLPPREGDWVRTVIFIEKQTVPGQDMYVRGGHDSTVLSHYGGIDNEAIVYLNLVGDKADNVNDHTLDWFSNSALAWTSSPGSSSYHDNQRIFYSNSGAGMDPENQYGMHWWKFEVFMKKQGTPSGSPDYDDWFEVKAFINEPDGSNTWESNIAHRSDSGPSPPTTTINHWAKKGHVNKFRFGQDGAEIYALNEFPLTDDALPYNVPAARPSPPQSVVEPVVAAAASVAVVGAAAVSFFVYRRKASSNPVNSQADAVALVTATDLDTADTEKAFDMQDL